ncbi:histidine decarboxylase [Streptomyces sp. NPDC091272]|uniref:histidine decarboxylase n=1 Tax=Streptomyces sp. NPDC091272 TaxID=3365981 RepID=UPI00381E8765
MCPSDSFELPVHGLPRERRAAALERLAREQGTAGQELGWQVEWQTDYGEALSRVLNGHVNNIGDPFAEADFAAQSKDVETSVLDYLARLWNARHPYEPDDADSYWGHLLTMGATEGNIYGLWSARHYLTGGPLTHPAPADDREAGTESREPAGPSEAETDGRATAGPSEEEVREPVLLFSGESHYSIAKSAAVLQLETPLALGGRLYPGQCPLGGEWPAALPTRGGTSGPGILDLDVLAALVEFFARRRHPTILVLNAGSTFKGAFDDADAARQVLTRAYESIGSGSWRACPEGGAADRRDWHWIHVDGALGAAYHPFLRMAVEQGALPPQDAGAPLPSCTFELPEVKSLVVSTHKWIGSPWPGGVYMTRNRHRMTPPPFPQYVGAPDTTLAGSRNGHSAVVLWDFLARHSYEDQIRGVVEALRLAQYAERRLREIEADRADGLDLRVGRSPWSLSVWFRAPAQAVVERAGLARQTLTEDGEERDYVHFFAMRETPRSRVDALLEDLARPDAFSEES